MILLKTKRSLPKNKAILERNWHKLVDKLKVMITDVQELIIKWTKISESGWRRIPWIVLDGFQLHRLSPWWSESGLGCQQNNWWWFVRMGLSFGQSTIFPKKSREGWGWWATIRLQLGKRGWLQFCRRLYWPGRVWFLLCCCKHNNAWIPNHGILWWEARLIFSVPNVMQLHEWGMSRRLGYL